MKSYETIDGTASFKLKIAEYRTMRANAFQYGMFEVKDHKPFAFKFEQEAYNVGVEQTRRLKEEAKQGETHG